jgi:energy-coupling factor transport system permease protein
MTTNTFVAGSGWLYRFDPRAKLLLMVLLCIWFFLPVTLLGLILVVLLIILVGTLNTGRKASFKTFMSILPMLCIMVLFTPFNVRDGKAILQVGSFVVITEEGLLQATRLAWRFIGITYVCTLLFATTVMNEVILSLRWYRLPYKGALVITLAFTYIPFIAESFSQISDSHRLREFDEKQRKKLFDRVKDLLPTLTSVLVAALRSIPNLAMSLELRGFGLEGKRTNYHTLSAYRHSFTHFFLSCMIIVVLYYIARVR